MGQDTTSQTEQPPQPRQRRVFRWLALAFVLALVLAAVWGWLRREEIVRDLVGDYLAGQGIEASYTIDQISAGRQIFSDIRLGDADQPDLIIDRLELQIAPRFGYPEISDVSVEKLRLFGTYLDGNLSFGALDPLIFASDDSAPFEFPDLELVLDDARVLLEGDTGPVAARLSGAGHLRGGFAAELAVVAPALNLQACQLFDASVFGEISIDAERPGFSGPLRFAQLSCDDAGLGFADGAIALDIRADRNLADFEGEGEVSLGQGAFAGLAVGGLSGDSDFTYRGGNFAAGYMFAAQALSSDLVRLGSLEMIGTLRALDDFARMELDTEVDGTQLVLGPALMGQVQSAAQAAEGTLAGALLGQFQRGLTAEMRGAELAASITARQEGGRTSVVVPNARLIGSSGASLLAMSRGQFGFSDGTTTHTSGNFATGGVGLPRISGRVEQIEQGPLSLTMQMQDYSSGEASLALPHLNLLRSANGAIAISGSVEASGAIPGGSISGLSMPLSGRVSPAGHLAMWNDCTSVFFQGLELSGAAISGQRLEICAREGQPLLRSDNDGLTIAAVVPSLALSGDMDGTPLRVRGGTMDIDFPGTVTARNLAIELGARGEESRFVLGHVEADLDDQISGTLAQAEVLLAAVPLNIGQITGNWTYQHGRITLSEGSFQLEDRQQDKRFEPMTARGAQLSFFDNRIESQFLLREPSSQAAVAQVALVHDLSSASGHADLLVEQLRFTENGLQPVDLTGFALGIVANVEGVVTGTGRIDWDAENLSSTGDFASRSLDLAAAFGQVQGASGSVHFTDLLGLTTAPGQRINVLAINPGIEIFEGYVDFILQEGTTLTLEDARWQFLGGELVMQPVTMTLGVEEERRYVFEIEGLEASQFIERMEMNNLSGSGIFDGTVPIIFDAEGVGRLQGGLLRVRPPGGNLSYIGQLSYEDLSAVGNFAFSTLRDLQYDAMEIEMDGPLTGELVTQVRFNGIRQGESASSNFLTRQIAKLPIELRVNIRAPFYQLMRTMSSMYDPSAVRDPRSLGLMRDDGTRLLESVDQTQVDAQDAAAQSAAQSVSGQQSPLPTQIQDESDIQPPESEATP